MDTNPLWSKKFWELSLTEIWALQKEAWGVVADWLVTAPMWKVGLALLALGAFIGLEIWSDTSGRRKRLEAHAERERQRKIEQHQAAHDYYKNKYK